MSDLRRITNRTLGHRHGPITRLISPGDLGALTKPFVFLDYVDAPPGAGPRFGFHPHSGIATLTFPLSFDIEHEDSTGQVDMVRQGGLEWVMAGGGIWHRAQPIACVNNVPLKGFQLWFSMPPSHELAQPYARFVQPADVPRTGPVTVLFGSHGDQVSPLATPVDANCLWVELRDGDTWTYTPPPSHQTAWVFSQGGTLEVSGAQLIRELAIFEEGGGQLQLRAVGDCCFLLGSAAKSAHALALGPHSVHTQEAALAASSRRITEVGQQLRELGRLG